MRSQLNAILFRRQIFGRERESSHLSRGERSRRKIHRSPWNDVYIPLKRESRLYERSHLPDKGTNNRSLPPLSHPLHFSRRPVNRKRRFGHVSTPEPFEVAIKGRFPGGCPRARFFVFLISLVRAGIRIICPFRFIEKKFFFFFFVYIYRIEEGFLFYSSLLGKQKKSLISLHILLHEN